MDKDRFEFGRNWQSYAQLVDEERVRYAEQRLTSMLGIPDLSGKTFLDIGCGSGVHSLAALRMGARQVLAIDLDPRSVAAAGKVLGAFWSGSNAAVKNMSVFDLERSPQGKFDVVYSWGVLHHTGDMRRAIRIAAEQTAAGGLFAVALYGKTPYCGMWKRIKRWYVNAPPEKQARAEEIYVRLFGFYLRLRGKRLADHIAQYHRHKRGMDFRHDVRDWIGGYPYESISPDELFRMLKPLGFDLARKNVRRRSGLFGSGNDEYLFKRAPAHS